MRDRMASGASPSFLWTIVEGRWVFAVHFQIWTVETRRRIRTWRISREKSNRYIPVPLKSSWKARNAASRRDELSAILKVEIFVRWMQVWWTRSQHVFHVFLDDGEPPTDFRIRPKEGFSYENFSFQIRSLAKIDSNMNIMAYVRSKATIMKMFPTFWKTANYTRTVTHTTRHRVIIGKTPLSASSETTSCANPRSTQLCLLSGFSILQFFMQLIRTDRV